MDIQILQLIEGAKLARGITVIIDVFRAFSVEAYLFERGAECIIPVGDKEFAYKLKKENPKFLLVDERHGKILATKVPLHLKPIVFILRTTTAT